MSKKISIPKPIRRALFLFVAVLIFSAAMIIVSESYLKHTYEGQESEKRAMRIWKNKIDGSRESNRIIDEYERNYLSLVKNNIVGEEDRLDWIENIQTIANVRNMSSVKYDLSSQKLLEDNTGQHSAQGLKVYRSTMKLDMKMAHEGDLFAVLNALQDKAKGLFSVERCDIQKTTRGILANDFDLTARCELGWYTFQSAENDTGAKL